MRLHSRNREQTAVHKKKRFLGRNEFTKSVLTNPFLMLSLSSRGLWLRDPSQKAKRFFVFIFICLAQPLNGHTSEASVATPVQCTVLFNLARPWVLSSSGLPPWLQQAWYEQMQTSFNVVRKQKLFSFSPPPKKHTQNGRWNIGWRSRCRCFFVPLRRNHCVCGDSILFELLSSGKSEHEGSDLVLSETRCASANKRHVRHSILVRSCGVYSR